MGLSTKTFSDKSSLVTSFADEIISILNEGITEHGRASLVVSGGSTPLPLFKELSQRDLDWTKVDITLADERWVDENHSDSNTKLVKQNLIQNKAANAHFVPLYSDYNDASEGVHEAEVRLSSLSQPFDVLILGMGEDGHTASLFPCSKQIDDGLSLSSGRICLATKPETAPHQRISLTLPAILNSKHIFLHLTGEKKKDVLQEAMNNHTEREKPITAVVNRAPVTLMWAP
ncbi:6-phosphogluconolactonase [Alteromonas sp. ASW11-130]|uniref:6-phosphogluconolactonase n=1 Tax=Alteromonas sp. ASW11-130 TaxID=3015775 RepID=UPI002241C52E|nr:6-phosphogluconolactonase [Alteromonas sp. ASW11-130]MCW8092068.1 6-phosphogluconolactonase [Alteromonas sp. ASW11-130]